MHSGSHRSVRQLVDDCYADDQCQSRSEYIEKGNLVFIPVLSRRKKRNVTFQRSCSKSYLERWIGLQSALDGSFLSWRSSRIVNNHILASDTDIDARSYQKMRGLSMDEVKRTNGRIDFEDALLGERGV